VNNRPGGDWSLEAGVTMRVREVGPDDWVGWRLLRHRTLVEDREAFAESVQPWTGDDDTEAAWRARLVTPGWRFVAEHGSAPVGTVAVQPDDDGRGLQLTSMWVVPGVRGRGIGRALVGRVIATAAGRPLRLRVMNGNDGAIRLYQRCGFVLQDGDPDSEGCRVMLHAGSAAT